MARKYIGVKYTRKLGPTLLVSLGFIMFAAWDSLRYTSTVRVSFLLKNEKDFTQLVPNFSNLTKPTLEAMKVYNSWERPCDLRIIVIVYDRAHSMLRLLNSLNKAQYGNDSVKLEVWIDRSVNGTVDQLTLKGAENFKFYHGEYEIKTHPKHVGIIGQWLSTWRVWRNSTEIAVVLEDDLTVSPFFYKYLKIVHAKYDQNPIINGYALQGLSIKHNTGSPDWLEGPKDDIVFAYPVLGTWGFSPSTRNWADFIDWFNEVYKDKDFEPYVPGNVVTLWYKDFKRQGKAGGVWSIWHIYYAWKKEEYTIYPNFEGIKL